MNDVPPGSPSPATLRARSSSDVFQSPFAAEAVAVGHQPLHGKTGQLP